MSEDVNQLHGAPHVERYLETDGADGYHWRGGTTILLLYTRGRRTGEQRINALIFRPWDGDFLVVASNGGADRPPAWFLNLEEAPDEVVVQIKGERIPVTARIARPEERPAMWREMTTAWPDYDTYQARTAREIPVVLLERLT